MLVRDAQPGCRAAGELAGEPAGELAGAQKDSLLCFTLCVGVGEGLWVHAGLGYWGGGEGGVQGFWWLTGLWLTH